MEAGVDSSGDREQRLLPSIVRVLLQEKANGAADREWPDCGLSGQLKLVRGPPLEWEAEGSRKQRCVRSDLHRLSAGAGSSPFGCLLYGRVYRLRILNPEARMKPIDYREYFCLAVIIQRSWRA